MLVNAAFLSKDYFVALSSTQLCEEARVCVYVQLKASSLSSFSDSEGCLLLVATHSSSHTGGQCCVHGVPHCGQGAQLFSQS